jgi:hypothetical protein
MTQTENPLRIFDESGTELTSIETQVTASYIMNKVSDMSFKISRNDPKCTEEFMQFGNRVYWDGPTGHWGGIIQERHWPPGELQVLCLSAAQLLGQKWRRTVKDKVLKDMTAGEMFRTLLADANAVQDLRIQPGSIWGGGVQRDETLKLSPLEHISRIASRSGCEWEIVPDIDSHGRLYFLANWYERMGMEMDFELLEGHNLKLSGGNDMDEYGDIVNDLLGVNDAQTKGKRLYSNKIDADSAEKYGGLRQAEVVFAGNTAQATLDANTARRLEEWNHPISASAPIALDVGETYANCALGNTVRLRYVKTGFSNGELGSLLDVRIMGHNYSQATKELTLTVENA